MFDAWYINFYNVIFTFCPVVIRAVFEEDISYNSHRKSKQKIPGKDEITPSEFIDEDLIRSFYPNLYYIGQKSTIFRITRFIKWIGIGFF